MPAIPLGEDRAFVEAMLAHDLVVRHDPNLVVVTSGRLQGRAKGGVADTIRLRCDLPDSLCDDRLERLERVVARSMLRRRLHGRGVSRRSRATGSRTCPRRGVRAADCGRAQLWKDACGPGSLQPAKALVRFFRLAGRFKRPDPNAWASEASRGQGAGTYMIVAPPDVSTWEARLRAP